MLLDTHEHCIDNKASSAGSGGIFHLCGTPTDPPPTIGVGRKSPRPAVQAVNTTKAYVGYKDYHGRGSSRTCTLAMAANFSCRMAYMLCVWMWICCCWLKIRYNS